MLCVHAPGICPVRLPITGAVFCFGGMHCCLAAAIVTLSALVWHVTSTASASPVVKLDHTEFEDVVRAASGASGDWFVLFQEEGCEECRTIEGTLDEVAAELDGVTKVATVKLTTDCMLRSRLDISEVPFLAVFSEGKMIKYVHPVKEKDIMVKYAGGAFRSMIENKRLCAIEEEMGGHKGDPNCDIIEDSVSDVPQLSHDEL